MNNNALILTLGHGASAILILDNTIVNGYQLERLTRVKGDSRFPAIAIEKIQQFDSIPEDIPIYISHWEPSGNVDRLNAKHYNPDYIKSEFPSSEITSSDMAFTHHDGHAFSALAYNAMARVGSHICVADGFGNAGEVMSFYEVTNRGLILVQRVIGYNQSLGLLYQYATDYVGLKQNQDEWKLNAKATLCPKEDIAEVKRYAMEYARVLVYKQANYTLGKDDPVTNMGALSYTHKFIVDTLSARFSSTDRPQIALFLQTVIERCMLYWIRNLGIEHLTVVGGCFLNVQLNGFLARQCKSFCAMPLSGDEGAGLGLYKKYHDDFYITNDLCWGKRDLTNYGLTIRGLMFVNNESSFKQIVKGLILDNKIVNVVRGSMEFGPRAYCNTSTLALPTMENRNYINSLNKRDPDMPMCPVMTRKQYEELFTCRSEISRSVEHMIMALEYDEEAMTSNLLGVAHEMLDGSLTGRPQVVDPYHWIYDICEDVGPLINTSFNNHGQPICYSTRDAVDCHEFMLENDYEDRVTTIILVNKEQ